VTRRRYGCAAMAQHAKDAQEGGPQRRSLRRRGVAQPPMAVLRRPNRTSYPLRLPYDPGEQVQLGRSGRPVNGAGVPKRHPANDADCTRENWEGPGWRGATRRPSRDRLEGEPLAATGQPGARPLPPMGWPPNRRTPPAVVATEGVRTPLALRNRRSAERRSGVTARSPAASKQERAAPQGGTSGNRPHYRPH
jgi:hypothetical protein